MYPSNVSQQQTSTSDDYSVPISSPQPIPNSNVIDDCVPTLNTSSNGQITSQTMYSVSSESTNNRSFSPTRQDDNSSRKKNQKKITKFLPLSPKQKNEKKKDQIDEEVSNSLTKSHCSIS
jgi:hypothetical protein